MTMGCHMDSVQSPTHRQTDLRETLCMEKRTAVASSSFLMEGRHRLSDFLLFPASCLPCFESNPYSSYAWVSKQAFSLKAVVVKFPLLLRCAEC